MGGNAAMYGAIPATGVSNALRLLPATRGAGAAIQGSRLGSVLDTAATAGLLAAATEPGGVEERMKAGLFSTATAPIIPMMVGGAQGARRMVTGRGKALGAGERLLEEYGGTKPDDVIANLRTKKSGVPGVRLTAAGAADSPPLATLETGSRVRSAGEWIPFDELNGQARWNQLLSRAGTDAEREGLRAARDAITGGLREEAMDISKATIGLSRGEFAKPIYNILEDLSTGVQRPNTQVQKVVNYVRGQFDEQLSPDQLYTVRKMLTGDIKAGVADDLTNAAKAARRETMGLVTAIDDAMDKMSGGSWRQYLDKYKKASMSVNSKQALQDVVDGLQKGWGGGTVPPVMGTKPGPNQFGRVVEAETKKAFGSKVKDLLSPEDRAFIEALQRDLAISQRGMNAQATIGSPTATYLANASKAKGVEQAVLEQGMNRILPLSGTAAGAVTGKVGALASQEGQRLLVEALQNPEIMAKLLEDAWLARRLFSGASQAGAGTGAAVSHSPLLGK